MSNSFYVIVPSTGAGIENKANKTNKFRLQLPKKLSFEGPGWQVGLAGIIYPNSWAAIGAHEDQFITVYLKNGEVRHFKVPKGSFNTSKHLEQSLYHGVVKELEKRINEIGIDERPRAKRKAPAQEPQQQQPFNAFDMTPKYPAKWERNRMPASQAPTGQATETLQGQESGQTANPPAAQIAQQGQNSIRQAAPGNVNNQQGRSSGQTPNPPAAQTAQQEQSSTRQPASNKEGQSAGQTQTPNIPMPPPQPPVQRKRMTGAEIQKELAFLMERDPWNYGQALEEYLLQFGKQIKATDTNLNEHIERNFEHFQHYYAAVERGARTKMTKERVDELMAIVKGFRFAYNEELARFELVCTNDKISHVRLTPQICYVLGFEEGLDIRPGYLARYAPDLRGAMSQLCIYMNHGVMESIIFGNTFSNLLQMVAVEGSSGETIQKLFTTPLMHRVIAKEIESMDFEVRSIDGRLVKFDYGQIILTLLFKRVLQF